MDKRIEDLDLGRFWDKIDKRKLTLNEEDGSYNYIGNLDFDEMNLKSLFDIPIRFKVVYGGFWCCGNQLISLEGAPEIVNRDFLCNSNKLISLQYAPKHINDDFVCFGNFLFSTVHFSMVIGKFNSYPSYDNAYNNEAVIKIIKEMSYEQRYNELKFFEFHDYKAYNKMLKILNENNLIAEEFKMCHTKK